MKNILKKIWNWIKKNWKYYDWIVFMVAIALTAFIIFGTVKGCSKPPDQEQIIIKEKDQKIKELNEQISNLEEQNVETTKKYMELKNKISGLEKQKQSIKKPEEISEIRDRFNRLGYNPK